VEDQILPVSRPPKDDAEETAEKQEQPAALAGQTADPTPDGEGRADGPQAQGQSAGEAQGQSAGEAQGQSAGEAQGQSAGGAQAAAGPDASETGMQAEAEDRAQPGEPAAPEPSGEPVSDAPPVESPQD
jgi:hypothetical protein